jgi:hypothetical protein
MYVLLAIMGCWLRERLDCLYAGSIAQPKNARDLAVRHRTNMGAGNRDVDAYLVEGILTEQVRDVVTHTHNTSL